MSDVTASEPTMPINSTDLVTEARELFNRYQRGNRSVDETMRAFLLLKALCDEVERLRELVVHMHVHSGYRDNGYMQMTTPQKALYDAIWERSVKELDDEELSTMSEPVILDDNAVAEIEARANAATEGPWRWRRDYEMPDGDKHWELSNPDGDRNRKTIDASLVLLLDRDEWLHRPAETQANWEFIAHAREDIPALCQTVRALRAEIREFERTDLVPRSRYDAADKDCLEAKQEVRKLADRARAEIERLESELAAVTQERDALSLALKKELERPLR
jgi:hypothetical protein